jgi:Transposase DDE domain
LLSTLFGLYPFQKKFADGGYQGPQFEQAVTKILPELRVEIVKRSDQAKGFKILPKRWVVERTFAWLSRCLARFREPDEDRARLHQTRLNPIFAEKTLSNRINLLDRLIGSGSQ